MSRMTSPEHARQELFRKGYVPIVTDLDAEGTAMTLSISVWKPPKDKNPVILAEYTKADGLALAGLFELIEPERLGG
jgi:hypothetical protein